MKLCSKYLIFFLITFLIISCKKLKTPEAIQERETWFESFSDSISYYEDLSKKIDTQIQESNAKISGLLAQFEKVNNPREVTGYYIIKGWSSHIPLKSTGIYARINENENLELIATLSGSTFNQIEVGGLYSDIVKHDQALNYRHATFNTVFFTGGKADSIAEYISHHEEVNLKLDFIEGKHKSQFVIPTNQKNMISQTWSLYSSQLEIRKLQKELAICSRKIDTFRRLRDDHSQSKKSYSD